MPWVVLALVFLDELLAVTAAAVWGARTAGWWLALLAALTVVAAWSLFASPKARYGGPVVRPLVKVIVFGAATAGLWAVGLTAWAWAFLLFSVVVNALALLPSVQAAARHGVDRGRGAA